jgi:hypothetical protein
VLMGAHDGVSGGAIGYHLAGRGSGVIDPGLSWT